jgi:hypothetical protein
MRPLQIWVPDTRLPALLRSAVYSPTLLREDPLEREILAFREEAGDRRIGIDGGDLETVALQGDYGSPVCPCDPVVSFDQHPP